MRYDSTADGMTPLLITLALGALFVLVYFVGYMHGRYVARRKADGERVGYDQPEVIDGLKVVREVVRD